MKIWERIAISSLKGKATHQTIWRYQDTHSNYWYLTTRREFILHIRASKTSLSWSFFEKNAGETKEYKAVKLQRATQKNVLADFQKSGGATWKRLQVAMDPFFLHQNAKKHSNESNVQIPEQKRKKSHHDFPMLQKRTCEDMSLKWFLRCRDVSLNSYLVGGFNPSEKYASKWGSFSQIGVKMKIYIWNHHLVLFLCCLQFSRSAISPKGEWLDRTHPCRQSIVETPNVGQVGWVEILFFCSFYLG